jgi:hypothetical protein
MIALSEVQEQVHKENLKDKVNETSTKLVHATKNACYSYSVWQSLVDLKDSFMGTKCHQHA